MHFAFQIHGELNIIFQDFFSFSSFKVKLYVFLKERKCKL